MSSPPSPSAASTTATATDTQLQSQRSTPPAFTWLLGLAVLAALVPTVWTGLDIGAASLFSGPDAPMHSVHWWWVVWINDWVPAAFRGMLASALVVWLVLVARKRSLAMQRVLAYVVLAGILGPGAVVNLGFKDHWQRARPYQVQNFGGTSQFTRAAVITDQCDANCSFVSGHVACGVFFASLALLHRRRQWAWAVVGTVSGLVIGFARMSDSAHWLSDVLWAFPITLCTCWLVWKAVIWLYGRPARKPSATVG